MGRLGRPAPAKFFFFFGGGVGVMLSVGLGKCRVVFFFFFFGGGILDGRIFDDFGSDFFDFGVFFGCFQWQRSIRR